MTALYRAGDYSPCLRSLFSVSQICFDWVLASSSLPPLSPSLFFLLFFPLPPFFPPFSFFITDMVGGGPGICYFLMNAVIYSVRCLELSGLVWCGIGLWKAPSAAQKTLTESCGVHLRPKLGLGIHIFFLHRSGGLLLYGSIFMYIFLVTMAAQIPSFNILAPQDSGFRWSPLLLKPEKEISRSFWLWGVMRGKRFSLPKYEHLPLLVYFCLEPVYVCVF